MEFIGRDIEIEKLNRMLLSSQSEMVAVVGRRRVGKTALIHHVLGNKIDFQMVGIQNATSEEQLQNFQIKYSEFSGQIIPMPPDNWLAAFQLLKQYILKFKRKGKKVIFLDELPWIVTRRSKFLEHLAHFWNDFAVHHNVLLILCGSATSWMIKKIVNSRGGLHNRLSLTIPLQPFTLNEVQRYIKLRKVEATEQQLFQLYMTLGGIPHYLKALQSKKSVPQNIQEVLFEEHGILENEFSNLMYSLFDNPEQHIEIIKSLSKKWMGLSRKELVSIAKIKDGGSLTNMLEELELSGFIGSYLPFGKSKKDTLFRLSDPYLLFYYKFIQGKSKAKRGNYISLIEKPAFRSWSGYAFENLCLNHLPQIKKALGIENIETSSASFLFRGKEDVPGIQIDLLIDRADQMIHLCEIKFSEIPFVITKSYADQLRLRKEIFRRVTKTKKIVNIVLIAAQGMQRNKYSDELIFANISGKQLTRK